MSDLDVKPCVADLDARGFCRGYSNPLAMMGVALDRYLPGCNAMLANESMYETTLKQSNAMYDGIIRFPIYLFFSELCYNVNRVV